MRLITMMLIVSAFLSPAMAGCSSDPIPDGALGEWRNPSPGWSSASVRIEADRLTITSSPTDVESYSIEDVSVETDRVKRTQKIEIEYETGDGARLPLSLVLHEGNPPSMQIGARADLWVRSKDYADASTRAAQKQRVPSMLGGTEP